MNDMPCINCLVFPICKSQVISKLQVEPGAGSRASVYRVVTDILLKKCYLIREFFSSQYLLVNHDNATRHLYYELVADISNDVFKILQMMY